MPIKSLSYFTSESTQVGTAVLRLRSREISTISSSVQAIAALCLCLAATILLSHCTAERRKSDAELGLTPQQAAGRRVYDSFCDRCHDPYSTRGKQGPGFKALFKKPYLAESGLPANDERVSEIIRFGRSKMPGYAQKLSDQELQDLLAYMHTL